MEGQGELAVWLAGMRASWMRVPCNAYLVLVVPAEVERPPDEDLALGGSLVQGIIVHLRDALKSGREGEGGSHYSPMHGAGTRTNLLHMGAGYGALRHIVVY